MLEAYRPSRLVELEAIVSRGEQAFLAVGAALVEIRDTEAFRELGHLTFRDYLAQRWPRLSQRSAYNAMASAQMDARLQVDGLSPSHLLELAHVGDPNEQQHVAAVAAARSLSVRELRALIRERQAARPHTGPVLVDRGPLQLPISADECRLEVGDCRALPFEDGIGHLDRVHGARCHGRACPHPFLVLESPPYNAGLLYDADPTGDRLPWREFWHELIVPHVRDVYRILPPGGRFALNLANVLRMNTGAGRQLDVSRRDLGGRKWAPPGANGEQWAYMVDRLVWSTLARAGFLERERFTWVKLNNQVDDADGDPADTYTASTAWGTWCSPENPVARAVSEPIYVADKLTHRRQAPEGVASDLDRATFLRLTRNTWQVDNAVDRTRHPSPWPRGVPDNLIRLYTWPGDLTADFFEGSGAAAESAVLLGRRHYGSDRSATYVHDAQHRVAAALAARGTDGHVRDMSQCPEGAAHAG